MTHDLPVVRIGFATKKPGEAFFCTGSIVSPQHILTAAHCVLKDGEQRISFASWEEPKGVLYPKAKVYVHPGYEGTLQDEKDSKHKSYANDVALVAFKASDRPELMKSSLHRLRFQASFGNNPKKKVDSGNGADTSEAPVKKKTKQWGAKLRVRGTGIKTSAGDVPKAAGVAQMPQRDYPIVLRRVKEQYFGARARRKVRLCRGDSGGPALFTSGARPVIWGTFSGFDLAPGKKAKGVFCSRLGGWMYWTKISEVTSWIEKQMQDSSEYGFGEDFECKEYENSAGTYFRCW